LTDIQGPEDHHGDMDFKVAGTKEGITAVQMDVKVEGVSVKILKEAFEQAKKARMEILDVMLKEISAPREKLAPNAPRVEKIKIEPEKIGMVIGAGGRMINEIIKKSGAEVDIEEDGTIYIIAKNGGSVEKAKALIEALTKEYEVGEIVEGPVTRIFDFGAMVQINPYQEGLVHISELAPFRVGKVTDVVNVGDKVRAKVVGIDEKGRVNLSIKQADPNYNPALDERNNRDKDEGKERKARGGNFRKRKKF